VSFPFVPLHPATLWGWDWLHLLSCYESLGCHVRARRHALLWILWNLGFESLLDLLEYILIRFVADERDAESLGTESPGTADTVEVGIGVGRQVVVDGEIDAFNINAAPEYVGGNADALVELFELLVAFDTGEMSVRWIMCALKEAYRSS
jgi:hypothetical protein